jgi:KDO2-lipid IV(A) lauroyltransferase
LRSVIHLLEYLAARVVIGSFQVMPLPLGRVVARAWAFCTWGLDRRSRKLEAAENLRRAFPEMGEKDARRTVRRVYYHLADSVLDWLKLARVAARPGAERLFETVGRERLAQLPPGKPIVFVTGHFGDWEALGIASSLMGFPVWAVGRSFANERLDRYINRLRGVTGQHVVAKHGATLQVFHVLAEGTNVALLIDQDARQHGIFVDFFGRPASTTDLAARLSLRSGSPVAFVYAHRLPGRFRFRLVCSDLVEPDPEADQQAEVHRITQRLTKDLEDVVRRMPEQWLWLHRRWKTTPGKYRPRGRRGARVQPVSDSSETNEAPTER